MELSTEEAEILAFFLAEHWGEFSAIAEEVMTPSAIHRLAEKLQLESSPS